MARKPTTELPTAVEVAEQLAADRDARIAVMSGAAEPASQPVESPAPPAPPAPSQPAEGTNQTQEGT